LLPRFAIGLVESYAGPPYKTGMHRCPGCRAEVKPREENAAFPFCSPRCRALDLARWFTGSYRVPGAPAEAPPQKRDDGDKE
jgi:endogenous inhibitor of DNA gyrase (YacG/DUF329 family)